MKLTVLAIAVVSLAGTAQVYAQSNCQVRPEIQSSCCNRGKDASSWSGMQEGIHWERSLAVATRRAAREGKGVLLFQLVGDLDKEGC